MRELMQSIFGAYTPITYTEVVDGVSTEYIASGLAGVDWTYIGEIFLFGIAFYSFFRLLGVILK